MSYTVAATRSCFSFLAVPARTKRGLPPSCSKLQHISLFFFPHKYILINRENTPGVHLTQPKTERKHLQPGCWGNNGGCSQTMGRWVGVGGGGGGSILKIFTQYNPVVSLPGKGLSPIRAYRASQAAATWTCLPLDVHATEGGRKGG